MNLRFHRHLVLALLLIGSGAKAADTPSGEEFSTAYPNPAPGYDAPGTYSNDPYAQPQQPAPPAAARGWSGQSTAPSNGYGASGSGYGSQGYGSGQAGGIQGGSFAGRGQTQGAGSANPYSSGKTFTKPPKTNVDPSAFGGGATGSNGWPQQNTETPSPTPY